MSRQMPKKIEELLYQVEDPDVIRSIQSKWDELVVSNDNYERNYPQQYGHLVEGNLKFKEQKSIPTPAEQLQMYESMVVAEIRDYLDDKEKVDKEATYELEQDGKNANAKASRADRLRLSFSDIAKDVSGPQQIQKSHSDIDKSQELGLNRMNSYKEQRAQDKQTPAQDKAEKQQSEYRLSLSFGKLEQPDRSEKTIEPEEPEMEKE